MDPVAAAKAVEVLAHRVVGEAAREAAEGMLDQLNACLPQEAASVGLSAAILLGVQYVEVPNVVNGISERIGAIGGQIGSLLETITPESTAEERRAVEDKVSLLNQAIYNLQGASETLGGGTASVAEHIGFYVDALLGCPFGPYRTYD